ncbi:MAG TPA: T9SS type A sorting domain-containing protein, partial [Chitinophagales bacterium]|nr:T9SS type A sorting domain-containing protein [Chitinophagales bacterium]
TLDNTAATRANAPQVIADTHIYLELKTNNEPEETGYVLTDTWGNVLHERAVGSLVANTIYKDTFLLPSNTCYRFVLHDIDPYGGDGLSFWANAAAGNGYARLRKVNGVGFIKVFPNDFGSRIEYNFTVGDVASNVGEAPFAFGVNVYPNPASGLFVLDCLSPKADAWKVEVFDVLSKLVSTVDVPFGHGGMHRIDLSHQPAGSYLLRVTHGNEHVTQRLMLVR